ncbi:hypothetical protein [Halovenus amylolytica]
MEQSEEAPEQETRDAESHFSDLDDGCGCTGIWEYLSEQRSAD